jgi:TolB-like protein/DNA-binding winged helix-turn-helix (wHTH) protein/Flp pilus assembly protein TadD
MDAVRLRIGEWVVEPRRNLISRANRALRLEPKVIELLVHLSRRPGEVASREELLAAVWPGVVVGDETLTQAVNKLRRSLGDDAHSPSYIETVSKRGYRLVASVAPLEADTSGPSRPTRRRRAWLVALAAASGVAAALLIVNARWPIAVDDYPGARDPLPIVAVLPLANQSGDPSRDYFYDGVTEDIINALGRFSGLRVISRSSVEQYKGTAEISRAVRDTLGARYVVSGAIRESGGELRVSVALSDAERGVVLWSERFAGAGADVFRIQDQIVTSIVGHLAVKVTKQERERAAAKPVSSLEAYDLVLRARPLRRESRASNRKAREMLTQALQLAPDYADAHVQLASAEVFQISAGWVEDPLDKLATVEKRLLAALAIDDPGANARAHGLMGYVHTMRGEFEQALAEVDRAVAINPSDALALRARGFALLYLGRLDESIAALETARRFDPGYDSADAAVGLALAYYATKRYPQALAAVNLTIARFPREGFAHAIRAATLAQMGKLDAARDAAARVVEFDPAFPVSEFGTRFRDPQYAAHLQEGLRKAGL